MEVEMITQQVFWDEFMQDVWQKEPMVIDDFSSPELVTEEQIFEIFLRSFDTFVSRKGTRSTIKIYMDGNLVTPAQCYEFGCVPVIEDKTYSNFYQRIKSKIPGEEFCVVIDRAELDPKTRGWVYNLLSNVYGRLGKVAPGSFAFFFLGNYSQTPFGIHKHDCEKECDSTFIFSLGGQKKVWLWNKGFETTHPDILGSRDIAKFEAESEVLTAKPGQAIYFPSFLPHVGESVVSDSQNLFIATKPAADLVTEFFGYLQFILEDYIDAGTLRAKLSIIQSVANTYFRKMESVIQRERESGTAPIDADNMQETAQTVPGELLESRKYLKGVLSEEMLDLMLTKFWLSILTSYGLISRTSTAPDPVKAGSTLRLRDHHILLYKTCNDSVVVGAAGDTNEFSARCLDQIMVIVRSLSSHEKITVKEILEKCACKQSEDEGRVLNIINKINKLNVFEVS